jgi:hypothetical protein
LEWHPSHRLDPRSTEGTSKENLPMGVVCFGGANDHCGLWESALSTLSLELSPGLSPGSPLGLKSTTLHSLFLGLTETVRPLPLTHLCSARLNSSPGTPSPFPPVCQLAAFLGGEAPCSVPEGTSETGTSFMFPDRCGLFCLQKGRGCPLVCLLFQPGPLVRASSTW